MGVSNRPGIGFMATSSRVRKIKDVRGEARIYLPLRTWAAAERERNEERASFVGRKEKKF